MQCTSRTNGDIVKRLAGAARELCAAAQEEAAFRLRLRNGKVNTSLGLDQVPFNQIDYVEQWLVLAQNAGHLDEASTAIPLQPNNADSANSLTSLLH